MTKKKILTDTDLVSMLRSGENERIREALDALYGVDRKGAVLVVGGKQGNTIAFSSEGDPSRLFAGLLYASVGIGKSLHLELNWIPDMEAMQNEASKIEVVPGSVLGKK